MYNNATIYIETYDFLITKYNATICNVHVTTNIKPKWFDRGKSWKWAFETNKIFALDQSLPSFQGETYMFSASLSIASFDKKSGRGYHWTMFPGRLIHCKSSESRICICNWSENNNLSGFFFTCLFILLKYVTYIYYKKEHIQEILYDNVTIILSLSFTCINCDSGGGGWGICTNK